MLSAIDLFFEQQVKTYYIGIFPTRNAAIKAYDKKYEEVASAFLKSWEILALDVQANCRARIECCLYELDDDMRECLHGSK